MNQEAARRRGGRLSSGYFEDHGEGPLNIVVALVVAYLLGSIPLAFFAGWMRGVDIRGVGSKSADVTNATSARAESATIL